eukprot:1158327-Pelagomonas_calceolata.AAC.2
MLKETQSAGPAICSAPQQQGNAWPSGLAQQQESNRSGRRCGTDLAHSGTFALYALYATAICSAPQQQGNAWASGSA